VAAAGLGRHPAWAGHGEAGRFSAPPAAFKASPYPAPYPPRTRPASAILATRKTVSARDRVASNPSPPCPTRPPAPSESPFRAPPGPAPLRAPARRGRRPGYRRLRPALPRGPARPRGRHGAPPGGRRRARSGPPAGRKRLAPGGPHDPGSQRRAAPVARRVRSAARPGRFQRKRGARALRRSLSAGAQNRARPAPARAPARPAAAVRGPGRRDAAAGRFGGGLVR